MITCPYCNAEAVKSKTDEVYPWQPALHGKTIYICRPCDAYVGCHPGTDIPLGRLANKELRKAKTKAHAFFDIMWRKSKNPSDPKPYFKSRGAAYAWLAGAMQLRVQDCHVGMFDDDQCQLVVDLCVEHREMRKRLRADKGRAA